MLSMYERDALATQKHCFSNKKEMLWRSENKTISQIGY